MEDRDVDKFRPCFKYFKGKKPPPDFSKVIDFRKINATQGEEVKRCSLKEPSMQVPLGVKPVTEWDAYTLVKHPGAIIILNPFQDGYQRYWIKRCMQDYCLPPNITNLDAHYDKDIVTNIYEDFVKKGREELHKDDLLMKLRWVTLGYHYDWTAKKYYSEKYTEFPWDLAVLSKCIAEATGHNHFTPEAGIVNYYHMDSTLAGHTDHSEFDKEAPLISISFGQDAVFLLGGVTKATTPAAMFLRSGDICVMGGPSRMAYHAVPRILPSTNPTHMQEWVSQGGITPPEPCSQNDCSENGAQKLNNFIKEQMENIDWKPLSVFLKTSRINVNIRQVLKPGEPFPEEISQDSTTTCITGDDGTPVAKKFRTGDS